jgi:streptomycin 6-kinase
MPEPVGVPEVVRNRAIAVGATAWLDALPSLVADLGHEWGLAVGRAMPGGTEAFVAEVTLENGSEAILKLLIPRDEDEVENEITTLRLANGDGCARLFRSDAGRSALLLERLGPSLFDLGLPLAQRHEILCMAAERMWRPVPDCGLPTGEAKGRWLVDFITASWEKQDRPCSERAVDYALSCATRRISAHDDERSVLVHGDIHQWNALKADSGFKLVDPDGLLAEPEYDLGILMREDPVELLEGDPRARSRWLAHRSGLDETAIWEWGVVERVSTGLVASEIDLQPEGRQMLAAAERASEG